MSKTACHFDGKIEICLNSVQKKSLLKKFHLYRDNPKVIGADLRNEIRGINGKMKKLIFF